jgi:hypothetical protein
LTELFIQVELLERASQEAVVVLDSLVMEQMLPIQLRVMVALAVVAAVVAMVLPTRQAQAAQEYFIFFTRRLNV